MLVDRTSDRINSSIPFKFQVLDYHCDDTEDNGEFDEDDDIPKKFINRNSTIYAFGVTAAGSSVCLRVNGYKPFFYICVPNATNLDAFTKTIASHLTVYHRANFLTEECSLVRKSSCYGYQGKKTSIFACLVFKTFATCSNAFFTLERLERYQLFEGKVEQVFKFLHQINDRTSWVSLKPGTFDIVDTGNHVQIDVECALEDFECVKDEAIAPIRQCTIDIECFSSLYTPSSQRTVHCNPNLANDVVFQVASTFKTYGGHDGFEKNHIIVLGPCSETWEGMGDVELVKCTSESDLLLTWARLINTTDPDIIYTWNGDNFDFDYMVKRAERNGIEDEFNRLTSRLGNKPSVLYCIHHREHSQCPKCVLCLHKLEKSLCKICTEAQSTFMTTRRYHMFGRIHADLLPYMRDTTKHRRYTLKAISEAYNIGAKDDVTPEEIYESYRSKDATKVAIVAKYCVQDTRLPQLIADKLKILPALIEISNATGAPILFILQRGLQARVMSILSKYTREDGMLIPDMKDKDDTTHAPLDIFEEDDEIRGGEDDDLKSNMARSRVVHLHKKAKMETQLTKKKYEGATVLKPKVGAYYTPIVTLDFAGLYPSIMQSDNLCYSTLIIDPSVQLPPDDEIFSITWDNGGTKYEHRYVRKSVRHGILPRILAMFAKLRKAAKKQLAVEQAKENHDEFLCDILDARQLSLKLCMNAIYGFTATTSLPCKAVSASITAIGRNMIKRTSEHIIDNYEGSDIIYGDTDSVFVDFKRPDLTLRELFEFSNTAAKDITKKLFNPPHELEFEKVYDPLFMLAKKKYFAMKRVMYNRPAKIENKGNVLQRRDVSEFVTDAFLKCEEFVLSDRENGPKHAVNHISQILNDLIDAVRDKKKNIDYSKFAIVKTYNGNYKNPESIPHAKVAMDLMNRGEEVNVGDKIEYVFQTERFRSAKSSLTPRSKSENAVDVKSLYANPRFTIDANHYIELLRQPITQFLCLVSDEIDKVFDEAKDTITKIHNRQTTLDFFSKKVYERK